MPLTDDQRQAASTISSISANVATAALAALAGLVALFTYLSQTYKVEVLFDLAVAGAAACLVASFVCSGLGTKSLVEKVAASEWAITDKIPAFRLQTWLAVAGLVLIFAATVIAVKDEKATDTTARNLHSLNERVAVLERERKDAGSSASLTRMTDQLEDDDLGHR